MQIVASELHNQLFVHFLQGYDSFSLYVIEELFSFNPKPLMLTVWDSTIFFQAHKYNRKALLQLVDPLLRINEHEWAQILECVRVAQLCVHHLAKHRPTMSEVVTLLGSIKEVQRAHGK